MIKLVIQRSLRCDCISLVKVGAGCAFHTTPQARIPKPQQQAKQKEEVKQPPQQTPQQTKAHEENTNTRIPSERVVKLVDELAGLSVIEFTDLSELLKKKLGLDSVAVSVPMMMPGMMMPGMMGGAAAAAAPAPAEEKPVEKNVFDVKLEKYEAADKIKIIKEVRAIAGLGLKEAKELVEKSPIFVKKGVAKEEANEIMNKLKAVGATIILE